MNKLPLHFEKGLESTPPQRTVSSEDLPVLQKITLEYKTWHGFLPQIPRLTRYSLGEKINVLFIELIELTLTATYASKERKADIVNRACVKLDTLKYFLQIAWELQAIDTRRFTLLSTTISESGKMLGGWRKQLTKETPPI